MGMLKRFLPYLLVVAALSALLLAACDRDAPVGVQSWITVLGAGDANIGNVDVASMSSLVSGAGYIGNVTFTNSSISISALPALPSGAGYIGYVTMTNASLPITGMVGITNSASGALHTIPVPSASWNVTGSVGITNSGAGAMYVIPGTSSTNWAITNTSATAAFVKPEQSGTGWTITNTTAAAVFAKLVAADGVDVGNVDVASIATGANIIGKVGIDQTTHGTTNLVSTELITRVQQIPLITAGAYHAADAVGNILTFTNASRLVGLGGTLLSVIVQDADKESAALELWLFDSTFTQSADNAAFDTADGDIDNCIGVIPIAAADYNTGNDWGVATIRNVNLPYSTIAGTSIYGQLKCTGTPTFGNTGDLTVTLVLRWN